MQGSIKAINSGEPLRTVRSLPALAVAAFVILFGTLAPGAGAKALAQDGSASIGTDRPKVTGFRSARFGMSKSETLEAIKRDFQLEGTEVETQPNDEDRTTSLAATVEDIFPGSGPAQVVYVHGYKQEKLIQVNILWGAPVTDEPDPQELVTNGNILRKYFRQLGYDPERTVMNTRVDDNTFIVFRATDEKGRMVLLQLLSRTLPAEDGEGEAEARSQVISLWLSYIENTTDPDVFRIEKGMF